MLVGIRQNRHEVPVTHRARSGGKSNYGLQVFLWRPVLDLVGVWWFSK